MLGRCNTGGMALSFRVVAGTSAPSDPQENTIWINTSVYIPAWYVGNEFPALPASGTVVIQTGSVSSAPMPAVRGKNITLYPISALQYVSGVWVPVAAATYQSGAWVPWTTYLFRDGDECEAITGGWLSEALPITPEYMPSASGAELTVTSITDGKRLTQGTGGAGGIYRTANKIDLTQFNTVKMTGSVTASARESYFLIQSAIGTYFPYNSVRSYTFPVGTTQYEDTTIADISNLSGEYYLLFGVYSTGKTIDLNRLSLER